MNLKDILQSTVEHIAGFKAVSELEYFGVLENRLLMLARMFNIPVFHDILFIMFYRFLIICC